MGTGTIPSLVGTPVISPLTISRGSSLFLGFLTYMCWSLISWRFGGSKGPNLQLSLSPFFYKSLSSPAFGPANFTCSTLSSLLYPSVQLKGSTGLCPGSPPSAVTQNLRVGNNLCSTAQSCLTKSASVASRGPCLCVYTLILPYKLWARSAIPQIGQEASGR